jgi:two-component system, chemotaxis family, sensor kinase CheA
MSLDMEQFHEAFYEESNEAIDNMEAGLLKLDVGSPDPDVINTVFRVAHSIKGGAGMFGFTDIMSFTHTLETLLDELRSGRMEVTQKISDLLLQSVDVLRAMLQAQQQKQPQDQQMISDLQFDLELIVIKHKKDTGEDGSADGKVVSNAGSGKVQGAAMRHWQIEFRPNANLLTRGVDPLRMFGELQALGSLTVTALEEELPPLVDLEPESAVLGWRLQLETEVTQEVIDDVFEWAEGDCELLITEVNSSAATPPPSTSEPEVSGEVQTPEATTAATPQQSVNTPADEPKEAGSKPAAKPPGDAGEAVKAAGTDATSIRVSIDKIDELINMVGEAVITQSMLMQVGGRLEGPDAEDLRYGLAQLERNVRELQESVMRVRMLPISFVFNRMPRLVRDLGRKLDKKVELKMTGDQTELDKTVLEKIGDPLVHLVRNSVDHGIETPEERKAKGKPEQGTVHLHAYHKGGNIMVEVIDDGAGLNKERILAKARERGLVAEDEELSEDRIFNLIFQPGFSTAAQVSDVSGRGVGMDVVRRNIIELGGNVQIFSNEDGGSTVRIRLPLTLAILDGQLIRVGNETYVVPLISIMETIQVDPSQINHVAGSTELLRLRDESIPVIRLHEMFGIQSEADTQHKRLLTIVESDGQRAGIYVDELLAQQQVVIKSLEANFRQLPGISGATMLGDGQVSLILDIPGLLAKFEGAGSLRSADLHAA